MATPHFQNLDYGFTYRSPNGTYCIDQDADAIVADSDNDLATLEVLFWWDESNGSIGVRSVPGKVSLTNGVISVVGVEIGHVAARSNASHLIIEFNDNATPTRVQELIRALTYTNSSSTQGFGDEGNITLLLRDKTGAEGTASVAIADNISGSGSDDTFTADAEHIDRGDELDGGAGNDVFQLMGGGPFELHRMGSIASIETIRGSAATDFITIDGAHLGDIKRIESGGNITGDTLTITGVAINLSGIAFEGFKAIALGDHRAGIIVDDVATAKLIVGYSTDHDTLTLTSGSLTASERQILHQQGIDTIVAKGANGQTIATTHRAPQIMSFGGAAIKAPIGTTVFLDTGQDAVLTADSKIIKSLLVHIGGASDPNERLGVHEGNGVRLLGRAVHVDGVEIGSLFGQSYSLSFSFDKDATDDRVQKLMRALTYTKTDGTADTLRKVQFRLDDVGGRETTAEVSIDPSPKAAPSDIGLSRDSVLELSPADSWVGDLSATDEAGSTFTYALVNSAGGRFKIEGGQLKVAQGTLLDHEQNKSHAIRIKATDQDGLSYEKSFTIKVDDVDRERIAGTVGNDAFVGGSGSDKLDGGYGNDRLTGGKGKDIFVFKSALSKTRNVDTITDFKPKDDTIQLENRIFKKLKKAGALSKDFFTVGTKAKDKNDYIVYDKAKGLLFYDLDGSDRGKAVLFAKLKAGVDHKDFFVI